MRAAAPAVAALWLAAALVVDCGRAPNVVGEHLSDRDGGHAGAARHGDRVRQLDREARLRVEGVVVRSSLKMSERRRAARTLGAGLCWGVCRARQSFYTSSRAHIPHRAADGRADNRVPCTFGAVQYRRFQRNMSQVAVHIGTTSRYCGVNAVSGPQPSERSR